MDFDILNPQSLWIIAGIILMCCEFFMPGFVLFFFGLGAIVAGLLCFFVPLSLNFQILIFIIISLISLVLLRKQFKKAMLGNKDNDDDLEEFIGHEAEVCSDYVDSKGGKVSFKGSTWAAVSDEQIANGENVKIIERKGLKLKVVKN